MKFFIKLISILTLAISFNVFAGSGKSILPHWGAQSSKPSYIFLSNITDNPVKVDVTFYGKNGASLSPSTFTNFSNGNTELAARSTGYITIHPGAWDYGYAVIEWENREGEDDTVALVGHGFRVITATSSTRSDFTIPINNGQPF